MLELNGVATVPDFSHLAKLKIEGKRAWFKFDKDPLGEGLLIEGLSANPSTNRAYSNAVVTAAGRREFGRAETTYEQLERIRAYDIPAYSKHVLTGWKGVKDASGAEVAFSPEAAEAFLRSLPVDLLDELRQFFANAARFREPVDMRGLLGNSAAGSSGS